MNLLSCRTLFVFLITASFYISCNDKKIVSAEKGYDEVSNSDKEAFVSTLQKHLNAVTEKDLVTLKSTMSPKGNMKLILPSTEIIDSVTGFMDYHEAWFQDTTSGWTFETKILNTEVGPKIGMGITEIVYREPERHGEPYFNRMIVSYDLEKIDGEWYIIKDHASSVEKSTDSKN